jgi:excisionase family DNA binding protein
MKTYTVKEIAEMLKTNPETVRRWIRLGKLEAEQYSRKGGNVITEYSLKKFLETTTKYAGIAGASFGALGASGAVAGIAFNIFLQKVMDDIKNNNSQIPKADVEKIIDASIMEAKKVIIKKEELIAKKKEEIKKLEKEMLEENKKIKEYLASKQKLLETKSSQTD